MADTIYAPDPWASLSAQHSDIRREQAIGFDAMRYAVATGNDVLNREILTSAHDTADKVDEAAAAMVSASAASFAKATASLSLRSAFSARSSSLPAVRSSNSLLTREVKSAIIFLILLVTVNIIILILTQHKVFMKNVIEKETL